MPSLAALLLRAKAAATGDRFVGALEEPADGASIPGALAVSGWTLSLDARVVRVEAFIDGEPLGDVPYGVARPDVARTFPTLTDGRCGFFLRTWLEPSLQGVHHLDVRATDDRGRVRTYAKSVRIPAPQRAPASSRPRLDVALGIARASTALSILDWGGGLASYDAGVHTVFAPPFADDERLLYISQSVDVVAIDVRDRSRIDEARRVARLRLVSVGDGKVETLWSAPEERAGARRVSIVIPVHGQVRYTDACLHQLQATLTADVCTEIIVVDDASTDETPAVLARHARPSGLQSCPPLRILRNDTNIGFGESCNRGARAAVGDIVVFLNNDTLPQDGWLAPLVETLGDERIGAAGSKLVYADGRLQEAGGVIFSDGTGWNFGHGEDAADAPLFNHVRDVDYVSGAALATRRELFLRLGGFDARFAPAYYEDTDYCFALRAAGLRVVYQPASVVVHAGGGTAGVDERAGVKSMQARNRMVFAEKWRDTLAAQPAPIGGVSASALHQVSVRDRTARRALVCAPRPPAFDRESGSKRVFDFMAFLRDAGWAVTFVAECADGGDAYCARLQQMGVAVYDGPETTVRGGSTLVDPAALLESGRFDLALLHFWWIGERYTPLIRRHSPRTRILVDSVDLHFLRRARMLYGNRNGGGVLDDRYASETTRELNAYAAADRVLTVSRKEADIVNDYFGRSDLAHTVPDAEQLAASPIARADRRGLLFLGNFRHTPNVEALAFLLRDIVPRIPAALLERHPISIVGNELTRNLVDAASGGRNVTGVHFTGWVPSVQPYLEQAHATLLPLRHGAGTKRKLIQAAMTGTPSVSTTIGVEGLPLRDGEHVLVADDPDAFARHIVRLVEDQELWTRLAAAGRRSALDSHSRDVVRARFHEVLA